MAIRSGTRALVRLETIAIERYVKDVLPDSYALWGDGRSFERYAEDFRTVAGTSYAKRRPFTIGFQENGRIVCSCKNYDRELRTAGASLRALGIGAVYTPPDMRGRGLASVMLGALLDAERAAGTDLAYLFSDIHPVFYERLGFIALPSRLMTLRAASLEAARIEARPLGNEDWAAIRRCFEALDRARPWSLRRTPLVWEWMRGRWSAPAVAGSQHVSLGVRQGRTLRAYAIGRRVPRQDAFVLDDFAYDGEPGAKLLPALLRNAAGDLARVTGWLPPPAARDALPRGSVRPRKNAILMIVPLSQAARAWWAEHEATIRESRSDALWSSDHV